MLTAAWLKQVGKWSGSLALIILLWATLFLYAPAIHFGTGTATLLAQMSRAGGDVIGLDWRIPIDVGWARVGLDRAVQGNLDPALLLGPFEKVAQRARDILDRVGGRNGHIFNLGHGVTPQASLENLKRLTDWVHEQE